MKFITRSKLILGLLLRLGQIDEIAINLYGTRLEQKGFFIKNEGPEDFEDLSLYITKNQNGTYFLNRDNIYPDYYLQKFFIGAEFELYEFFRNINNKKHEIARKSFMKRGVLEMKKITMSQLVYGLLLAIEDENAFNVRIDSIDIQIVTEFLQKKGYRINGKSVRWILDEFITVEISPLYGTVYTLDKDQKQYVGDNIYKLLLFEKDSELYEFFASYDREAHKRKRTERVQTENKGVLNANIFLIGDKPEQYHSLKEYGFTNIDYFPSVVVAERYFKAYPERLKRYHAFLLGNSWILSPLEKDKTVGKDLIAMIEELANKNLHYDGKRLLVPLEMWEQQNVIYFKDGNNWHCAEKKQVDKIYDLLVELLTTKRVLDVVPENERDLPAYSRPQNTVNPKVPTSLSQIKVLVATNDNRFIPQIEAMGKELGINIRVVANKKPNFNEEINRLARYDIVLTGGFLSTMVAPNYAFESHEQRKIAGRGPTLLAHYKDQSDLLYLDGRELRISYNTSVSALDNTKGTDALDIYIPVQMEKRDLAEIGNKYDANKVSSIRAALKVVINLYVKLLTERNLAAIECDLPSAESYIQSYTTIVEQIEKEQEKELELITKFNSFHHQIKSFLNLPNSQLLLAGMEGLSIRESDRGIEIEMSMGGSALCSVVISKSLPIKDIRIFEIKVGSKAYQKVAFYTSEFNSEELPPKPNEEQMRAFEALCKKVDTWIKPKIKPKLEEEHNQADGGMRFIPESRKKGRRGPRY